MTLSEFNSNSNRWTIVRMGAFYAFVLLFVAMAIAFVGFLMQWGVQAWYSTAFGDHRIHQIVDGALIAVITLGVAVQLYRPVERIAALQTSLVVLIVFAAFSIAGGGSAVESLTFVVVGLAIAALHPARGELIPSLAREQVSPRLAGLVAVAIVPMVALAVHQFGLQLTLIDDHAALGHWSNMAAFAVIVPLLGLLASLKQHGWLFPALIAGLLAINHGLASILFATPSGVGPLWGGLGVLWGLAFIGFALVEYTRSVPAGRPGLSAEAQPRE